MFANLGSVDDAAQAVGLGAEGVGLLRTEFLFLDRTELPGEEEQAETLRKIARALDGRPLVVRTLDAGADKPLPALPMPPEANPFLGVRGLRLALRPPASWPICWDVWRAGISAMSTTKSTRTPSGSTRSPLEVFTVKFPRGWATAAVAEARTTAAAASRTPARRRLIGRSPGIGGAL